MVVKARDSSAQLPLPFVLKKVSPKNGLTFFSFSHFSLFQNRMTQSILRSGLMAPKRKPFINPVDGFLILFLLLLLIQSAFNLLRTQTPAMWWFALPLL